MLLCLIHSMALPISMSTFQWVPFLAYTGVQVMPMVPCTIDDFLQKGSDLVAAGYVLYGTSTLLVYTTGHGVNAFTLDPSIGEFCLSHRDIKIPKNGMHYSINQGYYLKFDLELRRYIDHCSDLNLRLRYIGSMVSDVHRTLFQGGIFLYPNTRKYP